MTSYEKEQIHRMMQALQQAGYGKGTTSPNPPVGAVLYHGDQIIGAGYHEKAGEDHAEIRALEDARNRGNSELIKGAELYVTLEPCSSHGKTPPCTDSIIASGIKKVIYAVVDPNPRHRGRAEDVLHAAGIQVQGGVGKEACEAFLRPWMHSMATGKPWVIAKVASTLDGRIMRSKERRSISGDEAKVFVHNLRAESDALLVGGRTARTDDPALTVRYASRFLSPRKEQPWRIVMTHSRDSLPEDLKMFTDEYAYRTVVYENILDIGGMLEELYKERGVVQLMLECGGNLLRQFFMAGCINEWIQIIAPIISGGNEYVLPGEYLDSEQHIISPEIIHCGNDCVIRGLVHSSHS